MSAEDSHMDESFRRMSDGFQATYHEEFWREALRQLDNDALDQAFRDAAENAANMPNFELNHESLNDAFLDDAFRDAASSVTVVYDPNYWSDLAAKERDLILDEAFADASKHVVVNYSPLFWGEANSALEKEGLHHEYQHAYWNEARDLLDKEDRKLFFTKWTSVAIALLLISFFGLNSNYEFNLSKVNRIELKSSSTNDQLVAAHNELEQEQGVETVINEFVHEVTRESSDHFVQKESVIQGNDSFLMDDLQDKVGYEQETRIVAEELNEIIPNEAPIDRIADLEDEERGVFNSIETNEFTLVSAQVNTKPLDLMGENGQLKNEVTLLPVFKGEHALTAEDKIDFKPLELKPFHQISLVGLAGLGQNYGLNTYVFTKRYGAHFEYVYAGSKGYRAANRGHFEWGAQLGFNYVQCDGLGIENQVKLFKDNGEVEKYWRNLQIFDLFYGTASIFANYSFNQHHKLRLGVGVDRLIGVQSNMAFRMDDDKGIQTVNNNWGVQDGIANLDLKFSVGYEYLINRNWAFQFNFSTGMLNRTNNDFFKAPNGRDLERNLTIGIRRTLFTKL